MIAAISLMQRQDSVSLAQFRRHWLDVHGPLVCGCAADIPDDLLAARFVVEEHWLA